MARWNLREQIQRTNQLIKEEITRRPNTQYVDMAGPLLDEKGVPRRAYFETDGLHLTPAGYTVWQQTLAPHLPTVNNLVK